MPAVLEKADATIEKKLRINQMMSQKKGNSNGTLKTTTDLSSVSNVSITAFTIFAKTIVRERRIPFEISANADPFYSEKNQKRLKKSIDALHSGKGTVHELIDVSDEYGMD